MNFITTHCVSRWYRTSGAHSISKMQITITSIDARSPRQIGFTRMLSYPVEFSASTTSGTALFVPASGNPDGLIGQSLYVEVNQESVTDLHIVSGDPPDEFAPLAERGSFRVCGVVSTVVPLGPPSGSAIITVVAGDAQVTLCQSDLGEARPSRGDKVTFTAHEVSLWDEAI